MGELLNVVTQGDCLQVMQRMDSSSVDLVVTDPPYLMNYQSKRRVVSEQFRHIANDIDAHDLISEYFKECHRIMKDDTAIYAFCSWHHVDFFKREFERHFKLKNIIVWNKNNHGSGDLKGAYAPKHEFILYVHKGRSIFREKRIPDVIDCAKFASPKLTHPTEKPQDLLRTFIRNSSDVGSVVFDGFAGTGSTALSAMSEGRNVIAVEIDREYAEIANRRIIDARKAV